jgi:hypothetical protein
MARKQNNHQSSARDKLGDKKMVAVNGTSPVRKLNEQSELTISLDTFGPHRGFLPNFKSKGEGAEVVSASPECNKALPVCVVRPPLKGVLKTSQRIISSGKRVRFSEMPASDIVTGSVVPPSSRTGKEYRTRGRSKEKKASSSFKTCKKEWRSLVRQITNQPTGKREAQRRDSQKHLLGERDFKAYHREGGFSRRFGTKGNYDNRHV